MNTFFKSTADTMNHLDMVPSVTSAKLGEVFNIGDGFEALAFREKDFLGAMDPLVMVDHYRMTKPTFGAHPHAGLSAVSVLFEDSEGPFHNRDSLGNDFDIMPGDLYWLKAGSGVIHDESPRAGSKIHGLQAFVNLPSTLRKSAPESLHVKAQDMPIIECEGCRVRIVLGESNGVTGSHSPALPMTILDGHIDSNATFSHQLNDQQNAWIYAVKGELIVLVGGRQVRLSSGHAFAISDVVPGARNSIHVLNPAPESAQFVMFAGKPINEKYVQKGPFIMDSEAEIAQIEADYTSGKLGKLA
ncbi:pirin family protein [Aestuariibacter halophilus]|uniref:Pirin family protein n=1 Tax=Fluctibacter halophilus TaxID=226011 RepID=A0ABS8G4V7_9ALTE|nr:pirin-like C-terminal cupin domain-containing protein [Aestuariibacter halophilus]MCC2614895.1 pirin family protein [Aestuariibacter halophilus]